MKKLIVSLTIALVFLMRAPTTMAENQAGSSAQLSLATKIDRKELESLNLENKKLAIKLVLGRYGSPMLGAEDSFVDACKKYNLDCYLLPAIAGLESTFGRFIWPNSYNPFGWARGYMMFDNWSESIDTVASGLRNNYINRGALSVYEIGPIYSESPTWAVRVSFLMKEFEKEETKISLLSTEIPVKL